MNNYQKLDEYGEAYREPTREEKEEKFLEALTSYFSRNPFSLFSTSGVQKVEANLERLNKNLESSSESSTKLAEALNKLTKYGVLAAWVAVLVGLGNLVFEVIKYLWPV